MSFTRRLRRVHLSLLGRQPAPEDYQRVLGAADDAARQKLIDEAIEAALSSVGFYREMIAFGHDYLRVGSYRLGGANETYWAGHLMADLKPCGPSTKHAGAWGVWSTYPQMGDHPATCDDRDAAGMPIEPALKMMEPWWAPGTTVPVLGRAGSGVTAHDGIDCGVVAVSLYANHFDDDPKRPLCSCGPNLVYCMPITGSWSEHIYEDKEETQRRQLFEEPARFLAHLAWYDRPLTDLVLANYTVAPKNLQAVYARMGRRHTSGPRAEALDALRWWDPATWTTRADPEHEAKSPLAWREVVVEDLNPRLLALTPGKVLGAGLDRAYKFDPRTEADEPLGIGAAGVLTMMGSLSSFPRERVRAARWLETFACRDFVPPPATVQFNEYTRDPATEGVCQHCHRAIDPAAIHFKRWDFASYSNAPLMAGIGLGRMEKVANYGYPYVRWVSAFDHDLVISPVTAAQIAANPNARFLDFLPPDQKLFGLTSDGTIGPLGFAKLLVASGEFDACVARRLYERFVGRKLDPAVEATFIQSLATQFVSGGRTMRSFIRHLFHTDEFGRGW